MTENRKNISNSILIIDDDKWIQKLARNMLEKYGFNVIEALDPAVGLEIIIKENPLITLLDLHLPDVDGESLLYLIKKMSMTKDTTVVILSAQITKESITKAHNLGASYFVAKPFEEAVLIGKINECLDKTAIRKLKEEKSIKDEFFVKI